MTGVTRSEDGRLSVSPYLITIYNPQVFMLTLVTYICSICALVCGRLDRRYPINYVLLAVFTFSVSYMVGFITLFYQPMIVAEAACLTAAMVTGIAVYAATTKEDFTVCGPLLFIFFFVFVTAGIFGAICGFVSHLVYCCFGVVLFSFYLIWDI